MMVGLPGSGKSTLAEQLSKEHKAEIVSSDEIRKERFRGIYSQNTNWLVFKTMRERAMERLSSGRSVIYDSTNLDRKGRMQLLNEFSHADRKLVYYMNLPLSTTLYQNEQRAHAVQKEVIVRMYHNVHIPMKNEGWDQVIITPQPEQYLAHLRTEYEGLLLGELDIDFMLEKLATCLMEFKEIKSASYLDDTSLIYNHVKEKYEKEDKLLMLWVSVLHDIGKPFLLSERGKEVGITEYQRFKGHENVSSQLACVYLDLMGYPHTWINKVTSLLQFHTSPLKREPKKIEVKKLAGRDLYGKLLFLREAYTK